MNLHVIYGIGSGRKARPFSDPIKAEKFAVKVKGVIKIKIGYRTREYVGSV